MYCKNCGNELTPNAAVCLKCGVAVGKGNSYCQNCGNSVMKAAAVCTQCGALLNTARKSKLVAGLLGIFLGGLGVHNFYLGFTGKAIAQILLSFCFGIGAVWGFIEGILILCDKITTDANGVPLDD